MRVVIEAAGVSWLKGKIMRLFQIIGFFAGVGAFMASACFVGSMIGDTLWKVGVAILLGDTVCILIWPRPKGA